MFKKYLCKNRKFCTSAWRNYACKCNAFRFIFGQSGLSKLKKYKEK